jgi:hypothetical protein
MISVGRHEDVFFIKAEHQTVTATAAITKDEDNAPGHDFWVKIAVVP